MSIYGKVCAVLSSTFHSLPCTILCLNAALGLVLVEVSRSGYCWGVEVDVRGYYSVATYRMARNWVWMNIQFLS